MTKIIEAINKSFSRFIEPKWTRWTEEQPEERGRWTSLSKLLGGGSPPGPSPYYSTALWMKILASVMNTLSETICNSYPFKRDDKHQGRFHDMEMLRSLPPLTKERAVYISGSCNKIPLQNLNSIGSRSVVCLPIEWKSQSHSRVWVFNFHFLFCCCRLPFGATCIGRCTSLFMTNERRLGRRKSLHEWINAE